MLQRKDLFSNFSLNHKDHSGYEPQALHVKQTDLNAVRLTVAQSDKLASTAAPRFSAVTTNLPRCFGDND